ncbi:caspase family protein, partial [Acinetobacter baumannii]
MVRLVVALVLALAGPAVAHAAGRVALVVGIGNYAYVEKLPNPPKDAALIASALRAADFDVTVLQPGDLTRVNLIRALQAFRA